MRLIRNSKGFSLIESMVAGSILMASVFAGMQYIENQNKQRRIFEMQANERALAVQISSDLVGSANKYPPLSLSAGKQIYYIGCFNVKGQMGLNYQGKRDYAFFSGPTATIEGPLAPTGTVCNSDTSVKADKFLKYEVQVWWSDVANRQMSFKIFDLTGHAPLKRILKFRVTL